MMAIVIITVAGYSTVKVDIEAANPEREPPLGPEFEAARAAFLGSFREYYSGNNVTVYYAFNLSFASVAIAEAHYGFAFSSRLLDVNETAPGEYEVSLAIALHAEYGHVSTTESLVLKK